jgi:hypothetical protein
MFCCVQSTLIIAIVLKYLWKRAWGSHNVLQCFTVTDIFSDQFSQIKLTCRLTQDLLNEIYHINSYLKLEIFKCPNILNNIKIIAVLLHLENLSINSIGAPQHSRVQIRPSLNNGNQNITEWLRP